MRSRSTWEEEPSDSGVEKVALLTYVLGYDDLLADRASTIRLDEVGSAVVFTRGADGDAPGLGPSGELVLADRWASGRHAVLKIEDGVATLSDEGSRNGTFVNGARITRRKLDDGDLLELGHSLLCYRCVDEPLAEALFERTPPALGPTRTRSPEVAALVRDLGRIAPSQESVLVLGETGSGKEVVAGMIHERSGRRGAFVPVDCGAVPESLFESVFFGHRRGAFTGAVEARTGEIARADGGTLFLDEIGNLPAASQAKLLRALETGLVTPLGASEPVRVDVRRVAATNGDLFSEESGFRADLLQRLAGYVATLPPLRRRREDLGTLTAHLLREAGVEKAAITAAAGRRFFAGAFPGNVRQLRAALRSAALLANGKPIDLAHMQQPGAEDAGTPSSGQSEAARSTPSRKAPDEIDRATVEKALGESRGNVVQAARILGTHPRQLYRWIDRLGVSLETFRK